MCNAHNHSTWCTCGWGGNGRGGAGGSTSASNLPVVTRDHLSWWWLTGRACSVSKTALTHPTYCHICGATIFFHTNGNGDCVFFDELGPPWQKHGCFQMHDNIRKASSSDHLMKIAGLISAPANINHTNKAIIQTFNVERVGHKFIGVVLSTKIIKVTRSQNNCLPQKVTVWKNLLQLSQYEILILYTDVVCQLKVGQMVQFLVSKDILGGASVFFGNSLQVVTVP